MRAEELESPKATHSSNQERSPKGASSLSPSVIAAAYVNHKKKKSLGGGEGKLLSPPKRDQPLTKPKSYSVPKPSHHRYPPKSARDYTPSNARLFKEINACFSVKEEPLPLTARIPKVGKKMGQKKVGSEKVNKSEITGSVLTKLQKAFKQINVNSTLSPKRERKSNSLERLTGKRQGRTPLT